ncbi:CrcB family protein [Actinopolymorpha sp. B11F2]|uniref:fluoride efflux transporter FluC n=1 Tax=Actinopolymorpha sp. B11F2 TaxID=3160862 RepID=UPI0032E4C56C
MHSRPATASDDLPLRTRRLQQWRGALPVLAAVSAGGVLGSLVRSGVSVAFPHRSGEFAWATFAINVSGCLLIGVLMVLLEQVWTGRRLLRPFLGIGVLGGFTTFSTYILDAIRTSAEAPRTGLAYLAGTLLLALSAVWIGATLTHKTIARRRQESS